MAAPARIKKKKPVPNEMRSLEERIRQRAHEIYLQRGGADGSDLADWLQAEAEIGARGGRPNAAG
jgi:hypothetical protein